MYGANINEQGGVMIINLLSPMYGANYHENTKLTDKNLLSPMYGANELLPCKSF